MSAALPPLPAAFAYLCEWRQPHGLPNDQAIYYGEPGSAIEDDWNRMPDVHKNLPIFTSDQMQAYAQQARADLELENKQLRKALIDIKYGLESSRIWGGMEWVYHPLHPFKYLPLRDKANAALKEQP